MRQKHLMKTSVENIIEMSGPRLHLNSLLTSKAENMLRTQAKYYANGKRSTKLLARKLEKDKSRNVISFQIETW